MKIEGNFYIYVRPDDADKPWVIRYPDKKMPQGINEVQVKHWVSNVTCCAYTDKWNEARLGKYMVEIPGAVMHLDDRREIAVFSHRR